MSPTPILLGAAIVFLLFPKHGEEDARLDRYHAQDASRP
jgi:hypothetical protein